MMVFLTCVTKLSILLCILIGCTCRPSQRCCSLKEEVLLASRLSKQTRVLPLDMLASHHAWVLLAPTVSPSSLLGWWYCSQIRPFRSWPLKGCFYPHQPWACCFPKYTQQRVVSRVLLKKNPEMPPRSEECHLVKLSFEVPRFSLLGTN